MKKYYVVTNGPQYVSGTDFRNGMCGFTQDVTLADIFTSYNSAYYIKVKLSKSPFYYDYKVERLKESDWNYMAWNQIVNNAK